MFFGVLCYLIDVPCLSAPPKLGFVYLNRQKRDLAGMCLKLAASFDSCDSIFKNGTRVVLPATTDFTQEAIQSIKSGKVIAVPTDTIYGFACDACSREAVNRIYEIKGRKLTSPLAICVGDVSDIKHFAATDHLPETLLDSLLPGPVTVVLRRGESSILEKSLNPGADSVGVRVPDNDFIRIIARGSGSALALTSANMSGHPSSVTIKDFENLWEHCSYVYDGGNLPMGRAGSTIVDLTKPGKYKIIRPGSWNVNITSLSWPKKIAKFAPQVVFQNLEPACPSKVGAARALQEKKQLQSLENIFSWRRCPVHDSSTLITSHMQGRIWCYGKCQKLSGGFFANFEEISIYHMFYTSLDCSGRIVVILLIFDDES
ncbi:hypothetical protein KSS87_010707 [Heliosperma pusillum]|nr:hypothetical protein KSS87_010707 [Heliosperma pusillum]